MPIWYLSLLAITLATPAHAYVDPGFVGAMYQVLYTLVFGVIGVWVLKPYGYLKALFHKFRGDRKPEPAPPATANDSDPDHGG